MWSATGWSPTSFAPTIARSAAAPPASRAANRPARKGAPEEGRAATETMSPEHSSQLLVEFPDPAAPWRQHLPDSESLCALAARTAVAAAAPALGPAELAVALADDDAVRVLNRDWR